MIKWAYYIHFALWGYKFLTFWKTSLLRILTSHNKNLAIEQTDCKIHPFTIHFDFQILNLASFQIHPPDLITLSSSIPNKIKTILRRIVHWWQNSYQTIISVNKIQFILLKLILFHFQQVVTFFIAEHYMVMLKIICQCVCG